jgi:hypothetical protein
MAKDIRKYRRVEVPGVIILSWQDSNGDLKVARGKCLDISKAGMRVEVPEAIALRSYVTARAESMGLAFNASVRHCSRRVGKHVVGIEFSCLLKPTDTRSADVLARIFAES